MEKNFNYMMLVRSPVVPARFKGQMKNQQVTEGGKVLLSCELSKPGCQVQWKKGTESLKHGGRYQIMQRDTMCELQISDLVPEDSGEYSCDCGNEKTTAKVVVCGMDKSFLIYMHPFIVYLLTLIQFILALRSSNTLKCQCMCSQETVLIFTHFYTPLIYVII